MSTPSQPRPGRRAAKRRRRSPVAVLSGGATRSGLVALLLVVVAAAAAWAVGTRELSAEPVARPSGRPVTETALVCPQVDRTRGVASHVVVGAVPGSDLAPSGTVRYGALGERPATKELTRGTVADLDDTSRTTTLTADGPLAAGLFGVRLDHGTGVAVGDCPPPRSEWWFTGAGATLDHTSELVMANMDPGPAVVDVRVLGPDGEVDTVATRGITIQPGSQESVPLLDVAPKGEELTVQVRASRGRVVAGISDAYAPQAGATPGEAWLPDAASPSRVVRLAGTVGKADRRTLLVANPSHDLDALVQIELAGPSGTFAPAGVEPLTVPPGAVASVDLTRVIGKDPSAVRLQARVPVVATLRSTSGDDTTYAGMVAPLTGPAAAPLLDGPPATVLLTAGSLDGSARVTAYDGRGRRLDSAEVAVPARSTVTWTPRRGAGFVVVEPVTGAVAGGVTYSAGGSASSPLRSVALEVRRPVVEPTTGR